MKSISAYSYIIVGLRMRFLQNLSSATSKGALLKEIEQLKNELDEIGFEIGKIPLNSSRLNGIIDKLKGMRKDGEIGTSIASQLSEEFNRIELTIFSEASTKKVYTLPERRYNGDFLWQSPGKLLDSGVYSGLSTKGRQDFFCACKCIVYGEGTAAAFHILRVTEETLRNYYKFYKKTKRLPKPMWGTMINELVELKRNKPDSTIIGTLHLSKGYPSLKAWGLPVLVY